jgi:hypothetical protein
MNSRDLQRELIADYRKDPSDSTFGNRAMDRILNYFKNLPVKPGSKDPQRLGTQTTFLSNLKKALYSWVPESDLLELEGQDDFNKMSLLEQLKLARSCRTKSTLSWLLPHVDHIVPENLRALCMPPELAVQKHELALAAQQKKLLDDVLVVDAIALQNSLLPSLYNRQAKWFELAAGLLLASGRRSVEILSMGAFEPSDNELECIFSGQAKSTDPEKKRVIPLAIKFGDFKTAFDRLRVLIQEDEPLTSDAVNAKYANSLNGYIRRKAKGCNKHITAHSLRSIYAVGQYSMLDEDARPSLIGFLAKYLGHENPASSISYQRVTVHGWKPYEHTELYQWNTDGKMMERRVNAAKELMQARKPVTNEDLKSLDPGLAEAVNLRFLKMNKRYIDDYNASLQQ